jgi:hypothetical protein
MLWKVTVSSPTALHSRRHIAVVTFWIGARRRYTNHKLSARDAGLGVNFPGTQMPSEHPI